ncbi:MAG: class I SAM-dependent methyltransferase [Bacteroidales bacterium]
MNIICPFCSSEQTVFYWRTNDINNHIWSIYKCQNCHFYFINPFPSKEQLEEAYDQDYYGKGEKKFSFPFVEHVLDFFRSKRARKLKKYLNSKLDAHILDIGCGNGHFLFYLYKLGFKNLYGIELPGKSAERASKLPSLAIKIGEIENAMYDADVFDAITMFHVLEHTKNPIKILQNIWLWLKENGIVMISFPNIASRQAQKYKGFWLHLDPPRHLNFIAPDDFIVQMDLLGFELVTCHYFSIEQNPFGYIQSFLNKRARKREILFESLKGNKHYLKDVPKKTIIFQYLIFILLMPYFVFIDLIDSWQKKAGTVSFVFKKKSNAKK